MNDCIKLLKYMAENNLIFLEDDYKSVPMFDAKRPYGNLDYYSDMVEILGEYIDDNIYQLFDQNIDLDTYWLTVETKDKLDKIQQNLPNILIKIILDYKI